MGKWVSVKDRLPSDKELVLFYTPRDGRMYIGFHVTYKGRDEWDKTHLKDWFIPTSMGGIQSITKKVSHWTPLPEPPKHE